MNDRQLVLNAVQQMPEEASLPQILDELALLKTVKERLEKLENGGKTVPHEEVVRRLAKWTAK